MKLIGQTTKRVGNVYAIHFKMASTQQAINFVNYKLSDLLIFHTIFYIGHPHKTQMLRCKEVVIIHVIRTPLSVSAFLLMF